MLLADFVAGKLVTLGTLCTAAVHLCFAHHFLVGRPTNGDDGKPLSGELLLFWYQELEALAEPICESDA